MFFLVLFCFLSRPSSWLDRIQPISILAQVPPQLGNHGVVQSAARTGFFDRLFLVGFCGRRAWDRAAIA